MTREQKIQELRVLAAKMEAIRKDLKIGDPDQVLLQTDFGDDSALVVVSDGFGAAILALLDPNADSPELGVIEKLYSTEAEAYEVSRRLTEGEITLEDVFGEPDRDSDVDGDFPT